MRAWAWITGLALLANAGACGDSAPQGGDTDSDTDETDAPDTTGDDTTSTTTDDPSTTTGDPSGDPDTDTPTTVPVPECGNGEVEPPEECDDGNLEGADGCEADCTETIDTSIWSDVVAGDAGIQERGQGIATDGSGNVYVAGFIVPETGNQNIWVRKYDPDGSEVWTTELDPGAGNDDRGYGVAVDDAGNVYVAGSVTPMPGESDLWFGQLDPDGAEVWSQSVSGPEPGADGANDIALDAANNVVVVGYARVGNNDIDIWIGKYDSAGTELWTDTVAGPAALDDRAQGVAIDADDNVVVAGFVSNEGFNKDVWIRELDPDGAERWTTIYDSLQSGSESGFDVAIAPDGSVAVAGTTPPVANNDDVWLGRFDADTGELIFQKKYGGPAIVDDAGLGVAVDSQSNFVVVGFKGLSGTDVDIWMRKWDDIGNIVWTQTLAGAGMDRDEAVAVTIDADDNILVTGEIRPESNNNGDIWVGKFGPN